MHTYFTRERKLNNRYKKSKLVKEEAFIIKATCKSSASYEKE